MLLEVEKMFRKSSVLLLAALFAFASCATSDDDPNKKAKTGAAIGAAAGAIAGAIIGNQTGSNRTGAVIGAAVGAAIGGSVGHNMDQQQKELQQIPGVEVTRPSESQIDVRLTSDVLFDYNSAELRPESRSTLSDLAGNFRRYTNELIDVEGHTDATGTPDYNQSLSERRADSVKGFLIDQGVLANHIDAVGYGATRPRAENDSPEGRQMNRRVEIHIRTMQ